jgi:hypothetical protein
MGQQPQNPTQTKISLLREQASRKAKVEVNFKELISRKSLKTVRSKPEAMALSR